jgi:hypothetical protein
MVGSGMLGTISAVFATALPGGLRTWLLTFVPVAVLGVFLGLAYNLYGIRKTQQELARNYTTAVNYARTRPEVFLLHWRDFRVLSGPYEERPKGLVL